MTTNKNHNSPNVPNLRFPEFEGEWEKIKLKDVCTFYSGGTPSSSNKDYYTGDIPFIRSGELHESCTELFISKDGLNNSSSKIVHKGDLLLALYGATSGDIAISQIEGAINQAILCINTEQSKEYIKAVWQKHVQKILQTYLQGGQGNLSADIVKNISFYFALSKEQDKLANFIRLLDERIATQNKIIEDLKLLKSAIIDYIFNNDVLSVRKRIHLSDVATKVTQKNTNNHVSNVLSNSANQGIIPQSEVFDREIANEDNTSNYFVISQNDFVYNPRKSATAPYGPINRYNGRTDGVISPLYLCFRSHNINVEYLGWYFKSNSWYKYVDQNGDTGVRHDRVSIKDEIFFSMPLFIHNADEQIEIAKRLNKIESFVKQEEQYLFLLESQKLYLLQHLFI